MIERRQTASEEQCFVGNEVLACYPTESTYFVQDRYGKLIWNQNYPDFTNNGGSIDVYLFHQDDDSLQQSWRSVPNSQGRLAFLPQDDWWQGRLQADDYNGTDIAWPFYFVITYAGQGLDGRLNRLATWHAVQTALPVAVAEQRASASATASLSSVASATATVSATPAPSASPPSTASELASFSSSLASALQASVRTESLSGTQVFYATATITFGDSFVATATAGVLANGTLVNIPKKGTSSHARLIALVVVFGLTSLIALAVAWYVCIRAVRRKTASRAPRITDKMTGESDTFSDAPMIPPTAGDEERSPTTAGNEQWQMVSADHNTPIQPRDDHDEGEQEPLTSSEVWRIANAFRSALRKPVFNNRSSLVFGAQRRALDDGESDAADDILRQSSSIRVSNSDDEMAAVATASQLAAARALLREDLADEGQELKSVTDRKKPHLHTTP